jgi:ribosomal protein L37AE/L43A
MKADPLDDAFDLEENERLGCLDKVRKSVEKTPADFNQKDCVDCEDTLHEVRRSHGFFRCVPCQVEVDKRNKMKGQK